MDNKFGEPLELRYVEEWVPGGLYGTIQRRLVENTRNIDCDKIDIKEEIAELLYDELSYAYCDTCKYGQSDVDELDEDGFDVCDYCHRKSIYWAIRKEAAEHLADKILLAIRTCK